MKKLNAVLVTSLMVIGGWSTILLAGNTFTVPESMLIDTVQFPKTAGQAVVSRVDGPGASVDFTFTGLTDKTEIKDNYPVANVYGQTGGPEGADFSNFNGYMLRIENLGMGPISIHNFTNTGFTGGSGTPSGDWTNDTYWCGEWTTLGPGQVFVLWLKFDYAEAWNINDNKIPHTGGGLAWANGGKYEINTFDRQQVTSIGIEVVDFTGSNPNATIRVTPITMTLPPAQTFVDDDWAGEPNGKEVYFPGDPNAHYIGIDAFATIQDGIDAVAGSIVHVASGTYNEGLVDIDKSLSIEGNPSDKPVIGPAEDTIHANHRGWFQVTGATTVADFNNLKFDGSGKNIENCIRYQEGPTGTVENCDFSNIYYNQYTGLAVVYLDYTAMGGGSALDLDPNGCVKNCTFANIQRIGMMSFGVDQVNFEDCIYIGKGDGDYLDYSIEVGGGGVATIENCIIRDCTGVASSDGSTSAGILVTTYYGSGTQASIMGSTITGNTVGIAVGYDTSDTSTVSAHNNSISGNTDYGVHSTAPIVDAENNWWGDASGPHDPNGTDEADTSTCYPPLTMKNEDGLGDDAGDLYVDYCPWLTLNPAENILKLDVQGEPVYLSPDPLVDNNQVVIDMEALNLAQHVFGCQAILNFSSTYFVATLSGPGSPIVQAGGGIWDQLIYSLWNTSGDLDVAVGVNLQSVVGTKADGTVAKFTLTVKPDSPDGTTLMVFRPDGSEETQKTFFSDSLSQPVYPGSKIASQNIVIDGTAPTVTVLDPNGGENLKGGGSYVITWSASDPNIDYDSVKLEYYDGSAWQLIAQNQDNDGSYNWSPIPPLNINNAKVRITVWDLAGNSASDESDADFIIDSTVPTIVITSAKQGGQELIGTAVNAVQSPPSPPINIQVTASDALSGLAASPTVTVTPQGGSAENATFVNESPTGTFNYTWTVSSTTPNGTATIDAYVSDNAGNSASDSNTFNVNKNRITGSVQLEAYVGTSRAVTFVATGGASSKTWTPTLSFTGGVALFTLDDVPDSSTNLSAKTNWSLRRKVALSGGTNNQWTADLTGSNKLLGGDLNASNGVNILDYSILKTNWFTTNAVADINGDGFVQLLDYSILKANFFKLGNPE